MTARATPTASQSPSTAGANAMPSAGVLVSRVRVADFRGVITADLDLGPKTTFLVGENNSGKTSLLQAVAIAFGKRQATRDDLRKTGAASAGAAMIDVFMIPASGSGFDEPTRQRLESIQRLPDGSSEVVAFRTTLTASNEGSVLAETRQLLQPSRGDWVESQARFPPGALQVVDVHLLDASRDLLTELGNRTSTWGRVVSDLQVPELEALADGSNDPKGRAGLEDDLGAFAERLQAASPVLQQLETDLKRLGTSQTTLGEVDLRALPPHIEDLARSVEVVITQIDKTALPLRFHGLGSRSLASLLVFQTMCSLRAGVDRGLKPHLITLLEEPEAHLHPQAVVTTRRIINHLDGQAVVTTHSPQLVAEVDPQDVRLVRRTQDGTKFLRLPPETAKKIAQFKRFVERPLGEIFFARLVVFGDGTGERCALPVLLEPGLGAQPAGMGITFIDCENMDDPKLGKVIEALEALEIPWLLFLDNDDSGKKALAQISDPRTGAKPLPFGHANVVPSGEKQLEQMLLDAGYLPEITAVAKVVGTTVSNDEEAFNFLTSNKGWVAEQVAIVATAAGKAVPAPVQDLTTSIQAKLGISTAAGPRA